MNAGPLISIIMPCFNSASFIGDAIASVIEQSYPNWELIVVDGGSSDGGGEIVRRAMVADVRIKWLNNVNDKGPAHARSVGIRESRGDYIAFLDADDLWLPTKLEQQLRYMASGNCVFSYTKYRCASEDGKKVGAIVPMRSMYDFHDALSRRGIGTLTVMLRRHVLTDDIISVWKRAGGEEYIWWLLILRKGITAHLVPIDLARYRDTAGSLSKNQLYTLKSVWEMYRGELGLSLLTCVAAYVSYILDSGLRKVTLAVLSRAKTAEA